MGGRASFDSYDDFRNEILRLRAGPLVSPVDEIAEEMFHTEVEEETEPLWDAAAADDD
jgi:hypothetical protein